MKAMSKTKTVMSIPICTTPPDSADDCSSSSIVPVESFGEFGLGLLLSVSKSMVTEMLLSFRLPEASALLTKIV